MRISGSWAVAEQALSMYPEITMREERIPVVLRLMVKKRERWKKKLLKSSGGGGLYRVRHPLTSYVTKWGMNAIIPAHYQALTMRMMPTALLSAVLHISE